MMNTPFVDGRRRAPGQFKLARLSVAVSLGLLLCSAPLLAQTTSDADAAEKQDGKAKKTATAKDEKEANSLETITVTGIRASVERARDIKHDADTFVDSVSALDIGALPDRFSANGGHSLSFQDVPSELMSGIDVFKNQKADMTEGGLGGTVNLHTFMPFDFKEQKIAASVSENYGDFVKKYKPSGSLLYSNRWDTRFGEMGFLVDVATSKLSTRTDGLFVRPFFKNDGSVWVPSGTLWRTLTCDRQRDGAYMAFQWHPSSELEFFATAFQSKYHEVWFEDALFSYNDPSQVKVDASQLSQFSGDVFQSGRLTQTGGMPMGTDIRASDSHSKTTDFSTGLKWLLGTSTDVSSDLQYIKATSRSLDSTVALGFNAPYFDMALNGNSPPPVSIDSSYSTNLANYYWAFTMDHRGNNEATEVAWRADLKHSFDAGFIRAFKAGLRVTDRDARNIDTGYDWRPVFQTWMYGWAYPSGVPLPNLNPGGSVGNNLVHLDSFSNFYRGASNIPRGVLAPLLSVGLGYPGSYAAIHDAAIPYYINGNYSTPYQPLVLDASHTNVENEKTYAAYGMLEFGVNDANLSGNIGVCAVITDNAAAGFLVYPNQQFAPYLGTGQATPIMAAARLVPRRLRAMPRSMTAC